jgi:hypothetical protein
MGEGTVTPFLHSVLLLHLAQSLFSAHALGLRYFGPLGTIPFPDWQGTALVALTLTLLLAVWLRGIPVFWGLLLLQVISVFNATQDILPSDASLVITHFFSSIALLTLITGQPGSSQTQRLLVLAFLHIYFLSGMSKLSSLVYGEGSLHRVLATPAWNKLFAASWPTVASASPWVVGVLELGVPAFQVSLLVFALPRYQHRLRWAACLIACFHLGIAAIMELWTFSLTMTVLAFGILWFKQRADPDLDAPKETA